FLAPSGRTSTTYRKCRQYSRAQVNLAREPARRLPCTPEASRAQCVETVLPLRCFLRTCAFFTTASPGLLLLKLNVISQLEQGEDHRRVEQGPPQDWKTTLERVSI
ncbi:hypothetical protein Celaphus_00004942, partial [Cervus elaphus hippelaphus]